MCVVSDINESIKKGVSIVYPTVLHYGTSVQNLGEVGPF